MSGIERITSERQRQIEQEGWTPDHDDERGQGDLSLAAACYALQATQDNTLDARGVPARWPWDAHWWKPSHDPIRNLEKAGALIAAEIDRRERRRARA
ncbi:hypothetical protein [Thioalkalivibrio thiocyanodenitrificans]|uniref:hypothetical protein n=1 Tax=Thioalkalivibrio thiocyanodenitrificans TaxID=243063 RepID=UPI000378BB9B|nr:hypothetical protein [Thioalkalivibrio thiocyanodenitrificans]